jgi:NAD dependent epimerase/dehydratase family enzyme
MSWIHVDDAVELLMFALQNEHLFGPVNATAPEPVRNADFAHALGAVLHRPSLIRTPPAAIKLMFGEMAGVVLASQRVLPEAALRAGFVHEHPDLQTALAGIVHRP